MAPEIPQKQDTERAPLKNGDVVKVELPPVGATEGIIDDGWTIININNPEGPVLQKGELEIRMSLVRLKELNQ